MHAIDFLQIFQYTENTHPYILLFQGVWLSQDQFSNYTSVKVELGKAFSNYISFLNF